MLFTVLINLFVLIWLLYFLSSVWNDLVISVNTAILVEGKVMIGLIWILEVFLKICVLTECLLQISLHLLFKSAVYDLAWDVPDTEPLFEIVFCKCALKLSLNFVFQRWESLSRSKKEAILIISCVHFISICTISTKINSSIIRWRSRRINLTLRIRPFIEILTRKMIILVQFSWYLGLRTHTISPAHTLPPLLPKRPITSSASDTARKRTNQSTRSQEKWLDVERILAQQRYVWVELLMLRPLNCVLLAHFLNSYFWVKSQRRSTYVYFWKSWGVVGGDAICWENHIFIY